MTILVLIGSVGAGKTTLGKVLTNFLNSRKYPAKYIEININHGFAYLLTRFLARLLRYRYISNYYWTLRFGNPKFFCKYLHIMMIFDMLYAPVKILTSLITFKLYFRMLRKKRYLIILDEYYFTAVAEYMYHSLQLCKIQPKIFKAFYNIIFRLALKAIKNDKVVIAYLYTSLDNSVKASILRDNTKIVDIPHLVYKNSYIKTIVKSLKNYQNYLKDIKIQTLHIINFPSDIVDIAKILLVDVFTS